MAVPLSLAAAATALLAGVFRLAIYMLAFFVVSVAAATWVIWADPNLEITQDYGLNPVVRLVGGPIVILATVAPLALESRGRERLHT